MKVTYRIMFNGRTHKIQRLGWLGWSDLNGRGEKAEIMFSDWHPFKTESDADAWAKKQWGLSCVRRREFRAV